MNKFSSCAVKSLPEVLSILLLQAAVLEDADSFHTSGLAPSKYRLAMLSAFADKTPIRRDSSSDNVYHALHETALEQCRYLIGTMSAGTVVSLRATIAECIMATTSISSIMVGSQYQLGPDHSNDGESTREATRPSFAYLRNALFPRSRSYPPWLTSGRTPYEAFGIRRQGCAHWTGWNRVRHGDMERAQHHTVTDHDIAKHILPLHTPT